MFIVQFKTFFILALSLCILVGAKPKEKSATEIIHLKKAFNKMWVSDSVQFDLQKKVVSAFSNQPKVFSGKFYFSKGLVRIEFNSPHKSEIVIDEQFIWHAQKIADELGGWQVTKIKKSFTKGSQALLNLMFGDQLYWEKLKVVHEKTVDSKKGHFEGYIFAPKDPKDFPGITKISVVIDVKKGALTRISQWDELDNKVTYDFTNQSFDQHIAKSFFKYEPPKGVEVQNF